LEHVQPGGPLRRHDRRDETDHHGDHREGDQRQERDRVAHLVLVKRPRHERREEHPERQSDRSADQRRDHALAADHHAGLPARHPDRAEHPELPCPLEDGERERVDHPEDADDH
jgi:hypothetical protein